jgi:Asp-tRNA(Asn)/Glu-tRNA(Gln) amidotransferase A subunit family amidase
MRYDQSSKSGNFMIMAFFAILLLTAWSGNDTKAPAAQSFAVEEATIAEIHAALRSGKTTCRRLVETYLERIAAYDQPTKLNAIVVINPKALETAEALDKEFAATGKLRPLHGIPLIVKDNYETKDLQTAAGSLALKDFIPPDDAYQVRVLREAGAIVLAKSNMAEWAFSPYQTVSSVAGTTLNPYALDRVPAGSSGGTAAAVAANFGAAGLGTDTGNSIRGPSSHTSLVGIRPTLGLTSRDGIVPLYLNRDVGGPMARTVEDAAKILQVLAGYDPADPLTQACVGKVPADYTRFLKKDGLKGARLGVLRALINTPTADSAVTALMEKAIADMLALGATIIDPFVIPDFDSLRKDLWCNTFQYDVNNYFALLGEKAPVKNLAQVVESGMYAAYIEERLRESLAIAVSPEQQNPPCLDLNADPRRVAFREAVLRAMDEHNVDAVVYPSWSNPPRKVGDLESPHGNNSPIIAPHTGQPAITVPMGFTHGNLPAGLQILGRMFGEPELIKFAYAYEQATRHRRPPARFPSLQ